MTSGGRKLPSSVSGDLLVYVGVTGIEKKTPPTRDWQIVSFSNACHLSRRVVSLCGVPSRELFIQRDRLDADVCPHFTTQDGCPQKGGGEAERLQPRCALPAVDVDFVTCVSP